jgi:hypothetical protein
MNAALPTLLSLLAIAPAADPPAGIPQGYKLLYSQDFTTPEAINDFVFTDPRAWKISRDGDMPALELVKQSEYKPPHRSPFNIALIRDKVFADCVIECDCLQTGREYGHRDMIYVFGFQSPARYYYVHIATKADPNANNVFLVNDAPRRNIATETNEGNNWGLNKWHKVRIVRKASDGSVAVYFNDMTKPIMRAQDTTFGAGWVGFGSFDDTGKIANIKVWGPSAENRPAPPFKESK